jgi:cytochrome bd ubiquinol oxidase subunit I
VRGKLAIDAIGQQKLLLLGWIFAAPLGYIAVEAGWIVRCVGRQPWTVYGQLRTADAASAIPASAVLTSLTGFALIYSVLFVATLYFGSRIIQAGPNLAMTVPGLDDQPAVKDEMTEFVPDRRSV